MNSRFEKIMREFIPPIVLRMGKKVIFKRLLNQPKPYFAGNFSSWHEAQSAAGDGYASSHILERVRNSSAQVRDGLARATRDGVSFGTPEWNFPLIASLLRIVNFSEKKRLHLLDFGGALGCSYYGCRQFLVDIPDVIWCVVDQPQFFECGRHEFQSDVLHFCPTIEVSLATHQQFDVVLLSSVLQYLTDPLLLLSELPKMKIDWILIDRTPVIEGNHDRITLETDCAAVNGLPVIYPARLFGKAKFISELSRHWNLEFETEAFDADRSFDEGIAQYKLFLGKRLPEGRSFAS